MKFRIENRFHGSVAEIDATPKKVYNNIYGELVAILTAADAKRLYAEDFRVNCHSPGCRCEGFASGIISPDVNLVGVED